MAKTTVLVLGGGPDSEREVSVVSARCIADALDATPNYRAERRTIERIGIDELRAMPGEVIFPALHGGWGEGGPLQDLLEFDGRPFVGSASAAARWAMDKIATKLEAQRLGIPTPRAHVLDLRDQVCPMPFPVVVKPIHEGSTVGLHICRSADEWAGVRRTIEESSLMGEGRGYMIEPCITGPDGAKARELTVGLLDGKALPIIEIRPAEGLYDYEAKYTRNDTEYLFDPPLPPGVAEAIQRQSEHLARSMGVRHLARTDFMLDGTGTAWFLEINTLPGFTDHSLVPKAARKVGLEMRALCASLVEMAVRDHARR
ncbi:MAG: D-alanine--D-alanine ligase [Phycisphaerales bacterium]